MSGRDSDSIDRAFASNPPLRKRIFDTINATPQYAPLFDEIAQHYLSSQGANGIVDDGPVSKKRKVANGTSLPITPVQKDRPREIILEARDISFSLPQRKKLHLGIVQYGTDINSRDTTFAIFTRNLSTNEIEMEVPLSQFAYALRLPVPEKAAKQFNFVFLPKPGTSTEPVICSVNAGPLKSFSIPNKELAQIAAGPEDVLECALGFVLRQSDACLSLPSPEEFYSATPESHRKGDKAYHVKAFRGSKDGFLFLLSDGIFFGFKKPLAFFAFEDVESISYTSVLQRTFNLNIAYRASGADGPDADTVQEVEFCMLDQANFPGIDAYIKRHQLQDASLAEARRAKKLTNGKTSSTQHGEARGEGDGEDARTELEKAQQELDDAEDEEEEDYDPGSEGESEGSGSDEDDEDEYDREYEKERKKTKGKDLVKEELGSEAEDVSGDEQGEEEDEVDGASEHDDQEEEDMGEEEVLSQSDPNSHDRNTTIASVPAHAGGWKHLRLPDPDDDDQL